MGDLDVSRRRLPFLRRHFAEVLPAASRSRFPAISYYNILKISAASRSLPLSTRLNLYGILDISANIGVYDKLGRALDLKASLVSSFPTSPRSVKSLFQRPSMRAVYACMSENFV